MTVQVVEIPEEMLSALPEALSEAVYGLWAAQSSFEYLQRELSNAAGDPGVIALLDLSARGLKQLLEHEGELLNSFDMILRNKASKQQDPSSPATRKGAKS